MFRGHALITDFTGGEMSPRWFSRVQGGTIDPMQGGGSVAQYQSGCRDLTNMLVLPQGGVAKRTGTLFGRDLALDIPGVQSVDIQLFRFEYINTDYVTVWTPNLVTIYATDTFSATVALGPPVAQFATPFNRSEVRAMHVAQIQDVLMAFTGRWEPRAIRLRAGVWELVGGVEGTLIPPLYDFKDSFSPPTTLAKWEILFEVDVDRFAIVNVSNGPLAGLFTIKKNNTTTTLNNFKAAIQTLTGVVAATVQVVYTGTGGELQYEVEYQFLASVGDGNGSLACVFTGGQTINPQEAITLTNITLGDSGGEPLWSGPGYVFHNSVYWRCLLPHITMSTNEPGVGVDSATYWISLGATLPTDQDYTVLFGGDLWAVDHATGPFNRGWPTTGTAHEQRIVANGPPGARALVAGSRLGVGLARFLDFTLGENADDGFLFAVVVANGCSVVWLHSQKFLFVGTSVGVFVQSEIPLTATSVGFNRQSNYSLDTFRAFDVAGEVFYVQRNGRQIRRMQYVDALQSWQATDIASYAEHLFTETNRVIDQAYMNSPDTVQWVLRTDGGLLALTYERFFGVAAWSKHATQGRITALETFFGGAVRKDQVMLVVERDKWDGSALVPAVYLEALAETSRNNFVATPTDAGDWEYAGLPPSAWFSYVDSLYLTFGTGSATLPVPPRFVQKSVVVVQNGVVLGDFVVPTTGTITLPYPTIVGATINVGYRYPARVVPNRIELAVGNTAQSQRVRWTKPRFRLFESVRPVVNGQPARERSQGDNYDIATSLISGDIEIVNLDDSGDLVIEANEPLPFHMTGIFGLLTVEGG